MTVAELIDHLKTLKQDYIVMIGDSTYPTQPIEERNITEVSNGTYEIY